MMISFATTNTSESSTFNGHNKHKWIFHSYWSQHTPVCLLLSLVTKYICESFYSHWSQQTLVCSPTLIGHNKNNSVSPALIGHSNHNSMCIFLSHWSQQTYVCLPLSLVTTNTSACVSHSHWSQQISVCRPVSLVRANTSVSPTFNGLE